MCPACFSPGEVRMCETNIPFFKKLIIMAFSCEVCGHKSSEIKQGGGISEKATKIEFKIQTPEDLNRDIFKSDSCYYEIPELGFSTNPGTLGSMYTTVEGLLDKTITGLTEANPFGGGDSEKSRKWVEFIETMRSYKEGNVLPFTIILDDPLSNCFIFNPNAPEDDPQIEVTIYERT